MGKYKICVYGISKNEEKFAKRWMESMSEADMVVVTDTGSDDNTVETLRSLGAIVHEEKIIPWRFDTARNVSLSHVPSDIDIAICTDLDEVFRPGWRKLLEDSWTDDTTMGNYLFNWSLNADGTPDTQFTYFKVHAKNSYEWVCPVHEYLRYTGDKPEKKVFVSGMILDHYPDPFKSRSSYLPLLEMAKKEEPLNARMSYYLGREYMYSQKWRDCIDTLKYYLDLPTALWKEERCAAMRWIAKSYYELGKIEESYKWYYRAIAELQSMRDAYIEFAKIAYFLEDWVTVFYMTSQALNITKKSSTYVNMGYSWDYTPDDLASIACYQLNMYEKALSHAEAALSYSPQNKRLKSNLFLIQQKLKVQNKFSPKNTPRPYN